MSRADELQRQYLKEHGFKTKKETKKKPTFLKILYDKKIEDNEIAWCKLIIDNVEQKPKHNIPFTKRSLTKAEGYFGRNRLKHKYPKAKVIKVIKIKNIGYVTNIN